ncbi:MAG TPA: AAA family ATPase [Sphingobium sp.]
MTEELELESFISREREWVKDHMTANSLSWPVVAKRIDVASSTLSLFGGSKYAGDNKKIANKIKEYRELLEDQADLDSVDPTVPDFFEAPTVNSIIYQLRWAHRGKMVAIAGVSGVGKTSAVNYYRDSNPSSVIYIKVLPSDANLPNMLLAVLLALGKKDEVGSPQRLSLLIRNLISDRRMLLVFDEAHELSDKAMEEIRGWNDVTGVGIAFVGEPRLVQKIKATGRAAKPALASRTTVFELTKVKPQDVEACCKAWGSTDPEEVRLMKAVAEQDGALRECTQVFELASIVAAGRGQTRSLDHLLAACRQRGFDSRQVRAVAA